MDLHKFTLTWATDLDSLTSSLIYAYISSSSDSTTRKDDSIYLPLVNIPEADLRLRPEFAALLVHAELQPDDLITLDDISSVELPQDASLVLVDHNAPTGVLKQHHAQRLAGCIDHHEDEGAVPKDGDPRIIKKCGSCTSLVVQHFRTAWDTLSQASLSSGAAHGQSDEYVGDDAALTRHWDAQVAKLGMGSILIDTYNLQSESKVKDDDKEAVQYLEAKILAAAGAATWDRDAFFKQIDTAKKNLDPLTISECLQKDYKSWTENGAQLGFASVVKPIKWLVSKAGSMQALLEEIKGFSQERRLSVFVLMTAFADEEGEFRRELLVWALEGNGTAAKVAAFGRDSKSELGLEAWAGDDKEVNEDGNGVFRHIWTQTELRHSRKLVAPLVREAIKS